MSRVRDMVGVDLPFQSFLEMPTVAGMARSIETARQVASALLAPPLQRLPQRSACPLSYAQQRLWLLEQLGLSRHAYHLLEVIRLRGPLQVAALEQSLQEIVRRHEVLRTTFVNVAGQPCQVIRPAIRFPLSVVDLLHLVPTRSERRRCRRWRRQKSSGHSI